MGHVISTGLELVGTGSSVLRDKRLASTVRRTVELAKTHELTSRERNHVKAVELFSKGWVYENILNVSHLPTQEKDFLCIYGDFAAILSKVPFGPQAVMNRLF